MVAKIKLKDKTEFIVETEFVEVNQNRMEVTVSPEDIIHKCRVFPFYDLESLKVIKDSHELLVRYFTNFVKEEKNDQF